MAETAARGTNAFTPNTAHLAVLRADWHVVHNWDEMIEGRVLYTEETAARDTGAAVAIYRHFGNNMKVGVGYNFGDTSSDLRSFSTTENGLFLNIVAKYQQRYHHVVQPGSGFTEISDGTYIPKKKNSVMFKLLRF